MTNPDVFSEIESNVQSYARAFPCIFDKACGAELWDIENNRYLDFLAGAGTLSYGHNNPVFKKSLLDYIESDAITHSLDLHTKAKKRFLEAMRDIIFKPRGLDYVIQFTGPTGTNAVEAALKIARKVTGRTNVICFTNGFHGVSTGALAATGNKHHRGAAGIPLYGTTVMPYDHYFENVETIDYLEKMLLDNSSGVDFPAAVILETVQGEGGLRAARNEWLQQLDSLCKKHEILLIVDDIQAGCGRTGTFFSFEDSGIKPDIVTLSKSLSGYGMPFSIVLMNREIDIWEPGEHNGTFRGNNLAFVTATTMLEKYWNNDAFSKTVRELSEYLEVRLQLLLGKYTPHFVEIRGRGMMRGIVCQNPQHAASLTAKAYQKGLIIERSGPEDEVIKFLMPLTITHEQLEEGMDILEECCIQEFGSSIVSILDAKTAKIDNQDIHINEQLARRSENNNLSDETQKI
ncbi:MAG: diaminobutyrate--2-oxoglutarate transaminase [Gammaproteobacteria bacterium]